MKIVVDACPDANGFWTIRKDNGTPNGDTDEQPIATFYRVEDAVLFVNEHNAIDDLINQLLGISHANHQNQEPTL